MRTGPGRGGQEETAPSPPRRRLASPFPPTQCRYRRGPSPVPARSIEITHLLARPLQRSARRQPVSGPGARWPTPRSGPDLRRVPTRPGPGAPRAARLRTLCAGEAGPPCGVPSARSQARPPCPRGGGKTRLPCRRFPDPHRSPTLDPRPPNPDPRPGQHLLAESYRAEIRAPSLQLPAPAGAHSNPPSAEPAPARGSCPLPPPPAAAASPMPRPRRHGPARPAAAPPQQRPPSGAGCEPPLTPYRGRRAHTSPYF